jgi:hemerythrin-like domain-containing protein
VSNPVGQFKHSHAALTERASDIRDLIRAQPSEGLPATITRKQLLVQLELLRDDLLQHFAREEEGLFPFVRQNLPKKSDAVDRLAEAHDTICGAIVRLVHTVRHDLQVLGKDHAALMAHYGRFESAYAQHSQKEAALFEELGRTLDERLRAELTEILEGL